MKGVNASKIAAIAASAMLLASGVVSAGLMYENIELVNPNGQPTAKVVVGSQAQVSDGIAAANIAAVLANKAYKSSTLTATVVGSATCSAEGTTVGGSGTCEVLSKKALIEIIVPGQLANAYQFKTLITDTIDRTLQNRVSTNSEDKYTATANTNDVNTVVSPLRHVGSLSTDRKEKLYLIDGNSFLPFKEKTVVDTQASGFSYVVKERFWVGSPDNGVRFDENADTIIAEPRIVAYSVLFDGNDYGIPACTKAPEDGSGDWDWCSSSSQHRTANHRVKIPFLGSQWVISSMSPPDVATASSTESKAGGSIKLAKEANYDIINVGGIIDAGDLKVRLQDISVAVGQENKHPAILDILDSSGSVIGQIKVDEGETYTFTHSPSKSSLNIHVYKTAPGFTLAAKWAEIAIYSDEITLQDDKPYNLDTSGKNKNFMVSLIWKNRDYASSPTEATKVDSLREIVIYNNADLTTKKFKPGDTFNFLAEPAVFKLTYDGLDISDADKIAITAEITPSETIAISKNNNDCSNTIEYTGTFVLFSTSGDNFGSGSGSDLLGNYKVSKFYFDPVGTVEVNDGSEATIDARFDNDDSTNDEKGTQDLVDAMNENIGAASTLQPAIFYQRPGYSCYFVSDVSTNTALNEILSASNGNTIRFDYAGSDSGAYGLLFFTTDNESLDPDGTPNVQDLTGIPTISDASWLQGVAIAYQEDAGKYDTLSHYPVTVYIPLYEVGNSFKFEPTSSTSDRIYYAGIAEKGSTLSGAISNYNPIEPPFITERGSEFSNYEQLSYSWMVAKKVGQPTFTFSFTDAVLAESGEIWEAKEGETKTLDNGVKLKVKEIQVSTGTCKVAGGAAPTCTADMSGVSARIMPDNSATVQAVVPYDIKGTNLVISDREAGSVGGVQILVGGPAVNSATAEVLANSPVDFDVTNVYVKAIGNKIVVAGKTAADTMQAANEFISRLTVN
ncbi:MAG: hypothetical protein QXG16_00085 [Candidatus Anstonellaceae archaeon]